MPQVSRSFMGATLSRPRSNAIAPLAPTVARLTPNPINQTAIDSKYNDMKSARANSAFNEWYGALPPAQAAEFHYGAMQTPNTLSINGVSGATERSGDELSALARQKAREHFTANVLPTDQEYNQLGVQHSIERHGGTVGGAVAPLNPGLGTNVRKSTTTTDPVTKERVTTTELPNKPPVEAKPMTDVDRARIKLLEAQTGATTATTMPGGKNDPAIIQSKADNDAAKVGIAKQNADTAAGRAAAATQPSAKDTAKSTAQRQAKIATLRVSLEKAQRRLASGAEVPQFTPQQITNILNAAESEMGADTEDDEGGAATQPGPATRGGPSTAPASTQPGYAGRTGGAGGPTPTTRGEKLDPVRHAAEIKAILEMANGDPKRATELAKSLGWTP